MTTREKLDKLLSQYQVTQEQVKVEQKALNQTQERVKDCEDAQGILQSLAQNVQREAHSKIASVVSKCLGCVFEEAYTFEIDFERKRGRTEARLYFVRDGMEIDPLTASGGGVVDLASFALRLACLVLAKPAKRRLLVLDEPFRFVSRDYIPRVRKMLTLLSEDLGVQFLIVTHSPGLKIGKVVELGT